VRFDIGFDICAASVWFEMQKPVNAGCRFAGLLNGSMMNEKNGLAGWWFLAAGYCGAGV
jgi:hypothetical protein